MADRVVNHAHIEMSMGAPHAIGREEGKDGKRLEAS